MLLISLLVSLPTADACHNAMEEAPRLVRQKAAPLRTKKTEPLSLARLTSLSECQPNSRRTRPVPMRNA